MKTVSVLAIAGLFAASVSSAALAQANVGIGVNAGANAGDTGMGIGADVAAGAAAGAAANAAAGVGSNQAQGMNYGQVIASLRAAGDVSAEIEALDEDASLRVILLSELRGEAAGNAQALGEALSHQKERVADFRNAIEANATLSATLEAEGYSADDVVAVTTAADGEVVLIVEG